MEQHGPRRHWVLNVLPVPQVKDDKVDHVMAVDVGSCLDQSYYIEAR